VEDDRLGHQQRVLGSDGNSRWPRRWPLTISQLSLNEVSLREVRSLGEAMDGDDVLALALALDAIARIQASAQP
jgi:hypothetical protein